MIKTSTTHQQTFIHRIPIFYGWVVWLVATLGCIATAPAQSFTVSLFIDRFIVDFGLSRTEVSTLYSIGTLVAAFSLTWVGRKIDRYGNRRMGVLIASLYVLTLLAFSVIISPFMLLIGFVALRGLGQGSLWLVNNTVIAQWFIKRRGRVLSLTTVAFALFQSVYIPALGRLLEQVDWRQVWILLAFCVGVIVIPLTLIFIRNRPEDYDLLPDGVLSTPESRKANADAAAHEQNWTLPEAVRTPIFWVFLVGRVVSPGWGTGLVFHQISIFETVGHSAQTAAGVYGFTAFLMAVAALGSGWLIDRIAPGKVMAIQLTGLVLSMFLAMVMTEAWMLVAYAVCFGVVMGGGGVFDSSVWANVYGRRHQGSIRGFVQMVMVSGTAIGPIMFGLCFDLTGNYQLILWAGIVITLIPLVLSLVIPLPER